MKATIGEECYLANSELEVEDSLSLFSALEYSLMHALHLKKSQPEFSCQA